MDVVKYYDANGEELCPDVDTSFARFVSIEDYNQMVTEAEIDKKGLIEAMNVPHIPLKKLVEINAGIAVSSFMKDSNTSARVYHTAANVTLALCTLEAALVAVKNAVESLEHPLPPPLESAAASVNSALEAAETGKW